MNRHGPTDSREYPTLMAAVTGACALGAASAVVPVVEHIVGAVLVAAGLLWLAAAVLRRERRISTRLADPDTRPAPAARGRVSELRAGPGDATPDPPAPSTTPGADRTVRHPSISSLLAARVGTSS